MNKDLIVSLSVLLFSFLQLSATFANKTIDNLQAAFKGEITASAKYAAFAEQAKKEGLMQIASMFEATSRAVAIHAANHKKVIETLGQKTLPVNPRITVKTTAENLSEAITDESLKILTLYPGFIATAKAENVTAATKSFRWAMETEKKLLAMYQNALNALNTKKTGTLSTIYWVCPKCGNTYDVAKPESSCSFCSSSSQKFLKFGK